MTTFDVELIVGASKLVILRSVRLVHGKAQWFRDGLRLDRVAKPFADALLPLIRQHAKQYPMVGLTVQLTPKRRSRP